MLLVINACGDICAEKRFYRYLYSIFWWCGGKVDTSTVLFDSPLICRDWKKKKKLYCKKAFVGSGLVVEGTRLGGVALIVGQVSIDNAEKSTKSKEILKRKLLDGRLTLASGLGAKKSVIMNSSVQETIEKVFKGGVSNSSVVVLDNAIKKGKEEMLVSEMESLIFEVNVGLNLIGINKIRVDGLQDKLGCDALVESSAGLGGAERRVLDQGKEGYSITQLLMVQIIRNNVLFARSLAEKDGIEQKPPPTG